MMFGRKKDEEEDIMMEGTSAPAGTDALDDGIRGLVRGLQEEQFSGLRKEMEARLAEVAGMGPERFRELSEHVERVEAGLKAVRADVAKWLEEVREAKKLGEDAAQLRKRVEEAAGAGAEGREAMKKELSGVREAVASAGKMQKELVQEAAEEVRQLKERTHALAKLEEQVGRLNATELRRDIEALKAKAQWLEQMVQQPAESGLEQRVEELEALVARLRGASPVVLE